MDFIAVDVETANSDMSSICQIGFVEYENSKPIKEWVSLINPETYFDSVNISIHGIDETKVKDSPTFPKIADHISKAFTSKVLICHTHFDRISFTQAFNRYKLNPLVCTWLDSACVARRAWTQFAQSGYGLANVCNHLGFKYKPHDALEDARACAYVIQKATEQTNTSIEEWIKKVRLPIGSNDSGKLTRSGRSDGIMSGETVVFTGSLIVPRREAVDMAAKLGCEVQENVTKKTTIVVVGDQDLQKLAGHEKSSKHRKAEKLIESGANIRILQESDFKKLIEIYLKIDYDNDGIVWTA